MPNHVTLTVRSTHFYLVDLPAGKLMIDAGWEESAVLAQFQRYKIPITDVKYIFFTHTHPDHAGLIQNIRNLSGARLIIHEKQVAFLDVQHAYTNKANGYLPIRIEKTDLVNPDRAALEAAGIPGELVETPGHSPDSISFAFADGSGFIGDLPLPIYCTPEQADKVRASWERLIQKGASTFYHAHAAPIPLEEVRRALST